MGDENACTFGVYAKVDGEFHHVGDACEFSFEPEHETDVLPSWRELTETYSGQIEMKAVPTKAINELLGFDTSRPASVALSFRRSRRRTVRHRHVWQYRRERKGDRGKRRGKPRHERYEILTVLPDVRIKGAERLWSADAEAPVTVEFEMRVE